jgi:DNA-directed RNA polymerase specialized sigma24 family protein
VGWKKSRGGGEGTPALSRRDRERPAGPAARRAVPDESKLLKDEQLVAMLRAEGFSGPMWDLFIGRLFTECLGTVMKQIENGRIFDMAMRMGRPASLSAALRAHLRHDENSRHDLASDVLFAAVRVFRERALVHGEWSASGGASLRTFFLNMVALQFSNATRAWATSERDREHQSLTDEMSQWEDDAKATDPYQAADARVDLKALGRNADPPIPSMIQLRQLEWKPADIAEALGMNPRTAEKAWGRFTKQVRGQGIDGRPS